MQINPCLALLAITSSLGITAAVAQTTTTTPSPSNNNNTFCISSPTDFYTQNRRWTSFIDTFYIKKDLSTAFHEYVAANYIQHNPFIGSGAATALQALSGILPNATLAVLRYGMDKDLGWIHVKADGLSADGEPTAIVDIYRWNGSCVVEHWDVIQTRPKNATSPLALF